MKKQARHTMFPEEEQCRRGASVRLDLPPLDPAQAVKLIALLQKVSKAIWRTHGDQMANYLGCLAPDSMLRPAEVVWCSCLDEDDDLGF